MFSPDVKVQIERYQVNSNAAPRTKRLHQAETPRDLVETISAVLLMRPVRDDQTSIVVRAAGRPVFIRYAELDRRSRHPKLRQMVTERRGKKKWATYPTDKFIEKIWLPRDVKQQRERVEARRDAAERKRRERCWDAMWS